MRRHGTWTMVVTALVLATAGVLAPAAGAKPPKSVPPTTAAPTTTKPPTTKPAKQVPTTTAPPVTTAAPITTTTAPAFRATAAPAKPTITVTPNRGLVNLQEVQVSGHGFTPGESVGVVACEAGATTAFNGCDINNVAFLEADANGDWSTPFSVHVRIDGSGGGRTDCVAEFGACVISGTHGNDFTADPSAPIGFDRNAIPDPPKVTINPRTGLAHGQQITVSGTGAPPDVVLFVGECEPANSSVSCASDAGGFVRADGEGAFSLPITVTRLFDFGYPGSPVTDCLVDACVIRVVALDGLDNFVDTRITFDPDAPLPPRPTLTLTPDQGLTHGQVVRLTGTGFVPDIQVTIAECSEDADPYPQCNYDPAPPLVVADANGAFETTLTVKRVLGYPGATVDCLDGNGCIVRASSVVNDVFASIEVPIRFDPKVPLPPPPVLTITPDHDLAHGQLLQVEGRGFTPNTFVALQECAVTGEGDDSYGPCSYSNDDLQTDASGQFSTTFAVKRVIGFVGGPTTDCLDVEGCELQAYAGQDPLTSFAELELHFDRNAPLPSPPALTVTPHDDLGGRELVRVHGEGFAPETEHNLAECLDATGPVNDTPCTFGATVRSDAEGTIDATFLTRRSLFGFDGPIDCATTAEPCVLSVLSYDDVLSRAVAPLAFDPDAPPPPRPTITVTPSEGLIEGAVVKVTGRDFVPNAGIQVSECRGSDPSGLSCDVSIAAPLTTDDQGSFTLDYSVRPGLLLRDGIVGCYDGVGACTIQVATFGEIDGVSNAVPLGFGGSVTTPADTGGGGGSAGSGPTPVRVTPAPGRPLAFTGAPVAGYLQFAAIFLGLGTLLVLASRRRRARV